MGQRFSNNELTSVMHQSRSASGGTKKAARSTNRCAVINYYWELRKGISEALLDVVSGPEALQHRSISGCIAKDETDPFTENTHALTWGKGGAMISREMARKLSSRTWTDDTPHFRPCQCILLVRFLCCDVLPTSSGKHFPPARRWIGREARWFACTRMHVFFEVHLPLQCCPVTVRS